MYWYTKMLYFLGQGSRNDSKMLFKLVYFCDELNIRVKYTNVNLKLRLSKHIIKGDAQ